MKQTVTTPDSWNDVTISQFQEINTIRQDNKSKALEIMSILINEDIEDIRRWSQQSLNNVVSALAWCDTLPDDKGFNKVIEVKGVYYNLVPMSSFSVGEWTDLDGYFEEPIKNLHRIMGVFYRDNELPYDTKTADERAELFRDNINVGQVYGTVVFFSTIAKNCTITIKDYFQDQIAMMEMETLKNQKAKEKKDWLSRLVKRNGRGTDTYTA